MAICTVLSTSTNMAKVQTLMTSSTFTRLRLLTWQLVRLFLVTSSSTLEGSSRLSRIGKHTEQMVVLPPTQVVAVLTQAEVILHQLNRIVITRRFSTRSTSWLFLRTGLTAALMINAVILMRCTRRAALLTNS